MMPPTARALFARAHQTAGQALAQRLRDERRLLAKEAALLAVARQILADCVEEADRQEVQATLDSLHRTHTLRRTYIARLEAELARPVPTPGEE